jgi:hypothetical protein
MGILHNKLGISLTRHQPLTDSPFVNSFDEGEPFIPPGSEFMITETGIFMITESTLDLMITE